MTAARRARQVVKAVAGAADVVHRPRPGVVVLAYHRVGAGSPLEIDLPLDDFERQIAWLVERTSITTLDTTLELLGGEGDGNVSWPVVLTFDDGTSDFADRALPVLVAHGVPATVYVATDFIEHGREFPAGGRPLSWRALADARSTGLVTVGSHTHTHALLDRLPVPAVVDELERSIGLIEDRLGVTPRHFAYPKAVVTSPAAEPEVRRRFASAAIGGCRPNTPRRADPHRLTRSPVQRSDGKRWFERKVGGGLALEDSVRRGLNRWRYIGATT